MFFTCYRSICVLHTSQVGYDKFGLPIGLQFIGRPWSEATLIHLAFAMQVHISFIVEYSLVQYWSFILYYHSNSNEEHAYQRIIIYVIITAYAH